ncbi:MAG: RNA polymerase subunit sigma-70, partial [Flavobacteriaceae bacterium]
MYTWMYRIATNEALTHLKKSNRLIEQSIDKLDTALTHRLKADPYFDSTRAQDNLIEILST